MTKYSEVLEKAKQLIDLWVDDKEMTYQYSEEELKFMLINDIREKLESNCVIMTKEEFDARIEHERKCWDY